MSAKKAKALRKKLLLKKEYTKIEELKVIKPVHKVVYFKNRLGDTVGRKVARGQIVNPKLAMYKLAKKTSKGK